MRSADTPGLATGVYEPADPQAGRPERVQLFQAPLGFETPALLARLANTADKLFPLDHANPVVTPGNIYEQLSAIQLTFLAIHPFFEANGRVSEDMLYVLWNRRPDLAHTLRYPSSDGLRGHDHNAAEQRDECNVADIQQIFQHVAGLTAASLQEAGVAAIDTTALATFTDLARQAAATGIPDTVFMHAYDGAVVAYLERTIKAISTGDLKTLKQQNPYIEALATNLQHAPHTYRFADGSTL